MLAKKNDMLDQSFIACLAVAQLDQNGVYSNSPAGLLERIAIIIGWGWIALVALRLLGKMQAPVTMPQSTL